MKSNKMASSSNYRITPLQRENYDTWHIQAQAVLIRNGLWNYVSGDVKKPVDPDEALDWEKEDMNARSDLLLIIAPSELRQVKHCKTSKEVWDTLKNIYQSKGPARKANSAQDARRGRRL